MLKQVLYVYQIYFEIYYGSSLLDLSLDMS